MKKKASEFLEHREKIDKDFSEKLLEQYRVLATKLEPMEKWYEVHCPMKRVVKIALKAKYEIN